MKGLIMYALAIAIATAASLLSGDSLGTATTPPVVSVDTIPDSANTSTNVGTIQSCREVSLGETFTVDLVIEGVGELVGLIGFQTDLLYDPAILRLVPLTGLIDLEYRMFLASSGTAVIDIGDSLPDDGTGSFLLAAVQFPALPASGSGVLVRMRMEAIGSGHSGLTISNLKLADGSANPMEPSDDDGFYMGPINHGIVSVGQECSGLTSCDPLPPWPVPSGDSDCDGWTDEEELLIGTDPIIACGPDAWPPDFNDDGTVNVVDVNFLLPPVFGSSAGDPDYEYRHDVEPDGLINILDIARLMPPVFGFQCAN